MTAAKLTPAMPGPWEVVSANWDGCSDNEINYKIRMAQPVIRMAQPLVSAANCALIAAAPETAAECDQLRAINTELADALEAGISIIEKYSNAADLHERLQTWLDMGCKALAKTGRQP